MKYLLLAAIITFASAQTACDDNSDCGGLNICNSTGFCAQCETDLDCPGYQQCYYPAFVCTDCMTLPVNEAPSKQPAQPCIFPFIYDNMFFTGCTAYKAEQKGGWWCPFEGVNETTLVYDYDTYYDGWGTCDPATCNRHCQSQSDKETYENDPRYSAF